MATTYVSLANLQKYDGLLKEYIAAGWYDKTEIDEFLSDIEEREATFVTKSVNDLVNYYTKSETYTKTEVQNLISLIPTFAIVVVDELPTEDISPTTVYLVRNENSNGNIYTEYIYVNNQWEELGSQNINLDDYYTKDEVDDLIPTSVSQLDNDSEFVSETNLNTLAVTGIKGESELVYQKGDLTLNKRMVGLSLVENKSPTQILAQMTSSNVTSALGYSPLNSAEYVQNSSTTDGYVPKSNGAVNKVWGTDNSGLVGWQDASSGGDVSRKADKVTNATSGNFAGLDASGNLTDSGSKASDFLVNGTLDAVSFIGSVTVGTRGSGMLGVGSLANGYSNIANGESSHAEGSSTTCNGMYSHTEGVNTYVPQKSPGYQVLFVNGAHAEGYETKAQYSYQHVEGKYNDNKSGTLLEVGNGTADNARSNAFEVYSDGKFSQDNGATKYQFTQNNGVDGYYDASGVFHAFGGSGGASSLNDLSDVSLSSLATGQILKYNSTTAEWTNVADVTTAVKGDAESSYRTGNVNITKANIGLENVGNFKAVSTVASQGLTTTEQLNARTNIGAVTMKVVTSDPASVAVNEIVFVVDEGSSIEDDEDPELETGS